MRFRLLTASMLAAAVATPALADLHFDFDTGAQGWMVLYDGALTHQSSGGNPGGFLRLNDTSTATDFELLAPSGVQGDLGAYLGGSLSFQARNPFGVLPDWPDFGRITLRGAAMTVSVDGVTVANQPPADGLWHTYTVPLTVATFGADLPAVLGSLQALSIKTEFHQGPEDVIDIDNIRLSAVPEAPAWALLLAGGLLLPALRRRRTPAPE
jgi:hypothetical protein